MRFPNALPLDRRRLPPLSAARRERLEVGAPINVLGVLAHIAAAKLSRFERGLVDLTAAEEARRKDALRLLAGQEDAG